MGERDALMVTGFDLIGRSRTFQVHWLKRVAAFVIDTLTVFAPTWSFLYSDGVRAPWVYAIYGGLFLYTYSVAAEAVFHRTPGKYIVGLEVRANRGRVTFAQAAVRNIPKVFWFVFPILDTLAGLVVEGDPRQRWCDKILGTTVVQTSLVQVRVHRLAPTRNWAR